MMAYLHLFRQKALRCRVLKRPVESRRGGRRVNNSRLPQIPIRMKSTGCVLTHLPLTRLILIMSLQWRDFTVSVLGHHVRPQLTI